MDGRTDERTDERTNGWKLARLCLPAKAGATNNHDRRPWLETRIFIEMDSACRNQQGNCDEVENSARSFLLFFSIVNEFMQ